jgi:hypothetical protein
LRRQLLVAISTVKIYQDDKSRIRDERSLKDTCTCSLGRLEFESRAGTVVKCDFVICHETGCCQTAAVMHPRDLVGRADGSGSSVY